MIHKCQVTGLQNWRVEGHSLCRRRRDEKLVRGLVLKLEVSLVCLDELRHTAARDSGLLQVAFFSVFNTLSMVDYFRHLQALGLTLTSTVGREMSPSENA